MSRPLSSVLRGDYPDLFRALDRQGCGMDYSPRFRHFSLDVRPGGPVQQQIRFCPFSGKAPPPSLKDRFFDEIEALGFTEGLKDVRRAPRELSARGL